MNITKKSKQGGHVVREILDYTWIFIVAFFILENILEFKWVSLGT